MMYRTPWEIVHENPQFPDLRSIASKQAERGFKIPEYTLKKCVESFNLPYTQLRITAPNWHPKPETVKLYSATRCSWLIGRSRTILCRGLRAFCLFQNLCPKLN